MDVIAELKAQGVCVVFISHRLNELQRCADRVVVLRDGRRVGDLERAQITHAAMIRLMIGRDLKSLYVPPSAAVGECRLEVADVETMAFPGRTVNLRISGGEISWSGRTYRIGSQ